MSPDQSDRLLDFIAWSYVPSNKEINKEIINFPTYTDNEASRFTTRSSKDGIVLTRIGDRMHMHLETFLVWRRLKRYPRGKSITSRPSQSRTQVSP